MAIQDAAAAAIRNIQFNKQMRQSQEERDKDRALSLAQMGQSAVRDVAAQESGLERVKRQAASDQAVAAMESGWRNKQADAMLQGKLGVAGINADTRVRTTDMTGNNALQLEALKQGGRGQNLQMEWDARTEIAEGRNAASRENARTMAGKNPPEQRNSEIVLKSALDRQRAAEGALLGAWKGVRPEIVESMRAQGITNANATIKNAYQSYAQATAEILYATSNGTLTPEQAAAEAKQRAEALFHGAQQ